jgi:hypothetical protein
LLPALVLLGVVALLLSEEEEELSEEEEELSEEEEELSEEEEELSEELPASLELALDSDFEEVSVEEDSEPPEVLSSFLVDE